MNKAHSKYISRPWLLTVLMVGCAALQKSNAQTEALFLLQDSIKPWHSMITLQSDNGMGSNSVDLGFIKESVFGGYLDEKQIDTQIQRMPLTNRIGGFSNSALTFHNFSDTLFHHPEWGLKAMLSTHYLVSSYFKRDLFELIYRGNALSDSLALGPTRAGIQAYQKFSVGLFNKKNWNSISIGLVVGQHYQDLKLYNALLITNHLADSVTAQYNGVYQRSDTLASGIANGSGLGLAIDLDYQLPMANNKGLISISIQDVGLMMWNKNSESYRINGETHWRGVDLGDQQLQIDSISSDSFVDSIDMEYHKGSMIKMLPGRIQFRYFHWLNHASYCDFGIRLWPGTSAVPQLYAGLGQRPFSNLLFTQGITYGGFGAWGLGAGVQYMPQSKWLFALATQHLGGFTMSSAKSRHLQFSIAKIF